MHAEYFHQGPIVNGARIATWQLLIIPNIFFGKPLFKKSQEYKFKGCPILSLNMILPAILIAWLNKKITFKNSNGDKKNMQKNSSFDRRFEISAKKYNINN